MFMPPQGALLAGNFEFVGVAVPGLYRALGYHAWPVGPSTQYLKYAMPAVIIINVNLRPATLLRYKSSQVAQIYVIFLSCSTKKNIYIFEEIRKYKFTILSYQWMVML